MRYAPLVSLSLSLALSSCRCSDGPPPPAADRACASACAALVTAGCERAGLTPEDAPRCVAACSERTRELGPAGCDAERTRYLGCMSTARIDCGSARGAAAVCIEHRLGTTDCQAEHAAWLRCVAPCLHAGVEHSAERSVSVEGRERRVQARTVRAGCADCPELERGAPGGSPCQAPRVCSEHCCSCPDGRARYVARVCVDGRCAAEDACQLARAAGPDPCASEGQAR